MALNNKLAYGSKEKSWSWAKAVSLKLCERSHGSAYNSFHFPSPICSFNSIQPAWFNVWADVTISIRKQSKFRRTAGLQTSGSSEEEGNGESLEPGFFYFSVYLKTVAAAFQYFVMGNLLLTHTSLSATQNGERRHCCHLPWWSSALKLLNDPFICPNKHVPWAIR